MFAKQFLSFTFIYILIDYLFRSELHYYQAVAFSVTMSIYLTFLDPNRNKERQ